MLIYIKQYFTANYVGIKYFYEELYTVLSTEQYQALSASDKAAYDAEKKAAAERYDRNSEIANYVNSGMYNMDEAFMAVTGQVSADISVSAAVVGRNDSSFSKVSGSCPKVSDCASVISSVLMLPSSSFTRMVAFWVCAFPLTMLNTLAPVYASKVPP